MRVGFLFPAPSLELMRKHIGHETKNDQPLGWAPHRFSELLLGIARGRISG